jgi:ubiquinone/menaquinone biosynthesis C-methylase UbiE
MTSESVAFDRAAGFYDETRGFPPGVDKPVAETICRTGSLTNTSQVLEIGVGTGRIALPLATYVSKYYGIDVSRPMMNRLREKQTGATVHLAEANATRLPFASDRFDAVVAAHVFHLIAGWQTALDEVARVLKPDGVLLRCWSESDKLFQMMREAERNAIPKEKRHNVGVAWERYDTFLEDEGWRAVAETQSYHFSFWRRPQAMVEQVQNRVWSGTWDLNDEELAESIRAVRESMNAHFSNPDETVEVKSAFHVRAYWPPKQG